MQELAFCSLLRKLKEVKLIGDQDDVRGLVRGSIGNVLVQILSNQSYSAPFLKRYMEDSCAKKSSGPSIVLAYEVLQNGF